MATSKTPSLSRFLATAVACALVLSVAWVWVGLAYGALVINAVSGLLPDGVAVERHGHDFLFSVSQLRPNAPDGALQLHTFTMRFHTMMMSYGLIVAAAVLLAVPGLRLRHRLLLLLGAVLVGVVAHVAGLAVLVPRFQSVVQAGAPSEDTYLAQRMLTWAWLFVPSLVWLPVLLRRVGPAVGGRASSREAASHRPGP